MIFNITDIKTGKKKEEEVNFTYSLDEINDDRIKPLTDLDINGKVYYADGGVYRFEGTMTATCEFVCDRCGESFTSDFEADFAEEFMAGVDENDDDYFLMENDNIDLSVGIKKNFLLNIPQKLLCSEDCEGISYDPEAVFEANKDESKEKSPFACLKDLKF